MADLAEWDKISSDPEFKALPVPKQVAIKQQYDNRIAGPGSGLGFDAKKSSGLDEEAGAGEYVVNSLKKGVANTIGAVADTGQNIINLGGAAAGAAGIATGAIKPDDAYEPHHNPTFGSEHFKRLLGVEDKKAPSAASKFVGDTLEATVPMVAMGPKAIIEKGVTKTVASMLTVGGGSTVGKDTMEYYFPNSPAMSTAGMVVGGMVIPSYLLARGKVLANVGSTMVKAKTGTEKEVKSILDPYVEYKAKEGLKKDIESTPGATKNIEEAAELEKKIPGLQFTGGARTGSQGVIVNEQVSAQSSPQAFEVHKQAEQSNKKAIEAFITPGPVATSLEAHAKEMEAKQEALIIDLTKQEEALRKQTRAEVEKIQVKTSPEQRGDVIRFQRAREEGKAKVISEILFNKAKESAAKEGAVFSGADIEKTLEERINNPLVGFDPKNAASLPSVARELSRIKASKQPPAQQQGAAILGPDGKPMQPSQGQPQAKPLELNYDEVRALEVAINQDIQGVKSQLGNPYGRQQIRALYDLKKSISGTIANSQFPETAKNWAAAMEHYKSNYAQRLLTGLNFKSVLRDSLGEDRVRTDALLDNYTKNAGNARRFVDLYKDNPEATQAIKDHMTQKYERVVFGKDGEFSEAAHSKFMQGNQDVLRALEGSNRGISAFFNDTKRIVQGLADKQGLLSSQREAIATSDLARQLKVADKDVDVLIENAMKSPHKIKVLSQGLGEEGSRALTVKVMDGFIKGAAEGEKGLSYDKLNRAVTANETKLAILFKQAYGEQGGQEYLSNLKAATRALEIQARVELNNPKIVAAVGRDPLRENAGITIRSLFSLTRAVVTGRSSLPDVAIAAGGQSASIMLTKRFNEIQQNILNDPEKTKELINAIKLGQKGQDPETKEAMGKSLLKLLQTGGYYFVGGNLYKPTTELAVKSAAVHAAGAAASPQAVKEEEE